MISRTHLRQFLAVVETGNFTRAASRINVSQPTLSAGISELEKRLGAALFARSNRRVQLTEAGNRLLPHARAIEREFLLAEQSVTGVSAPVRPIRLGVLATVPTALLAAAIAGYDGVEPVEVIEGGERELTAGLGGGQIDLALTLLRAGETRFQRTSLFEEGYRLALPVRHALARRESIAAEEVAGETMIARRSCEVLADTSRYFTERGVRPPFSLRSPNDDKVMAMVRAGLGITVAPESLETPGVAMPRLAGFDMTREIGLLFAPHWKDHYGDDSALVRAIRTSAQTFRTDGQRRHVALRQDAS
ncbi:LysR family transcriptional regulator [Sphingomonas cavernae]|uniref:LysR family transcriptional regulator n=1 Tax=Sphingomonas cavernae TaxID=2320861 RepID=A0A418W5P0_9SPHN|nr:LysR family transcriptional regulator [Sphingomonas cavernae]RJF85365.1 LysR family transcriptional regulator [Sphingomonas cavernae]